MDSERGTFEFGQNNRTAANTNELNQEELNKKRAIFGL